MDQGPPVTPIPEKKPEAEKPLGPTTIRAYVESRNLGWEVSGPFYSTLPTPKPEYIEKCAEDVDVLTCHLLETVIIKDQFDKDHSARRVFETNNPEIGTFSSKYSKLGGNRLIVTMYAMAEIIKRVGRTHPLIAEKLVTTAKLAEIGPELEKYNKMAFEEKVSFTRKLDDVIYKFLEVLSQ